MKKTVSLILIVVLGLSGCGKCYECTKSTSTSSSTHGACFERSSDAKAFKRDLQDDGYTCRVVPEP